MDAIQTTIYILLVWVTNSHHKGGTWIEILRTGYQEEYLDQRGRK
jgi:hypothetical protein